MKELSRWFEKIARPLPWRENHDPYRIWVSEIMLQQTQVDTVLGYYSRFLNRFPSLKSLAESKEQDVLTLWSGLGYYRRAKNLRAGAQYIMAQGGYFPKTREEILKVPGIGPYTAGAILSIAFNLPEPLVDGNVNRVFARYFGVKDPIQKGTTQKLFWSKASELVKKSDSPRIHNQALMELGSLVCKKGTPLCERCPIAKTCAAFKNNLQLELPVSLPRKATQEVHWIGLVFVKKAPRGKDLFFVKQNIGTSWWDGLWDFPILEKPLNIDWDKATNLVNQKMGQKLKITPLNHAQHSVTHHRIQVAPFIVEKKVTKPMGHSGRWLSVEEIGELPLSSLAKKIFRQLPLC